MSGGTDTYSQHGNDRQGLPKFQNQAVRGAIGQTQGVRNQGMPQVQGLSQPNGPVAQTGAMGNQFAQDELSGRYLNPASNPFLNAYANAATQGLVQNYQNATAPETAAAFLHAGSFGDSSAYNQAKSNNEFQLANAIGNTEANIYEPAYMGERQLQQGALSLENQAQQGLYTAPTAPLNYQNQYNQGLMGLMGKYGYGQNATVYPSPYGFTPAMGIGTGLGLLGLATQP